MSTTTQKELTCRMCGRPVTVEIDNDYAKTFDPFKLFDKVACNRCGDFEDKRKAIIRSVKGICEPLSYAKNRQDNLEVRESLRKLCKSYVTHLCKHHHLEEPEWDDHVVESLISKPLLFADVMKTLGELVINQRKENLI